MNDPISRFKQQPWQQLFFVAFVTVLVVSAADLLFIGLLSTFPAMQQTLSTILSPRFQQLILPLVVAVGMGSLAVYFCDFRRSKLFLNTRSLWALVLCLMILLGVKSVIPLPSFLIHFSYPTFIGIMIGVFLKGRYYWR